MAVPIRLTTGQVYLVGWSGAISGGSITLTGTLSSPTVVADTIKLDVANQDVILVRDAANTLAQRNGTTAQAFRVYNTYTDATHNEYLSFRWQTNVAQILSDHNNGVARNIQISPASGLLILDDNNNHGVQLDLTTDATAFCKTRAGADGCTLKANNLTATGPVHGGQLIQLDIATGAFAWNGRSTVRSGSDGKVSIANSAETSTIAFDVGSSNNGQSYDVKTLTELTTIAAAASTDTTIQMPANSVVLGVSVRVTTVIPTAATFTVGDSGSAARFSTAAVSAAATSTDPGTKAGAYYNASALSIRLTPNAQPADNTGRVRVTIYYYAVTPPTS